MVLPCEIRNNLPFDTEGELTVPPNRLIVLVHGFFKDKRDMDFLGKGLSRRGHKVFAVDLPTTFGSLEDCCRSMDSQLSTVISRYGHIGFVTHSMGALITRAYLEKHPIGSRGRCVFIAPPHHGSVIGDILARVPLYSHIFRPVNAFRTDSPHLGDSLFLLPDPADLGVIAGSSNDMLAGRLLLSCESDGRVEVESTRCADMKEHKVLPYNHHRIHHNDRTLEAVDRFLREGTFGM